MVAPKPLRHVFQAIVEGPEGDDRWWVAFCPEVPEANGQGETEAEALENLKQAIELVLSDRLETGLREMPARAHQATIVLE